MQVQLLRRGGGKLDVVTYSHLLNHVGKQEGVHAAKVRCPETHIHIHTFKHTFKHTLHTLSQTRSMYEIAVPSSLLTRSSVSVYHHADCSRLYVWCHQTVLGWMREDGVCPNDVTYTSMIHLLGQAHDYQARPPHTSPQSLQGHVNGRTASTTAGTWGMAKHSRLPLSDATPAVLIDSPPLPVYPPHRVRVRCWARC